MDDDATETQATATQAVPAPTQAAEAARRARLDREAAALRQNLRRRKDHMRERVAPPPASGREIDPQCR